VFSLPITEVSSLDLPTLSTSYSPVRKMSEQTLSRDTLNRNSGIIELVMKVRSKVNNFRPIFVSIK